MLSRTPMMLKRSLFAIQSRLFATKPNQTKDSSLGTNNVVQTQRNKVIIPANSSTRIDNAKLLHVSGPMYATSLHQVVFTDASGIAAAGYWKTSGDWFMYNWPSSLINYDSDWMELVAILLAARLWGHQWKNFNVDLKTDNQSMVSIYYNHAHSETMEVLNKKLHQAVQQHGFALDVSYIHGRYNPADAISRDKYVAFLENNPSAKSSPTPIPHELVQDLLPQ